MKEEVRARMKQRYKAAYFLYLDKMSERLPTRNPALNKHIKKYKKLKGSVSRRQVLKLKETDPELFEEVRQEVLAQRKKYYRSTAGMCKKPIEQTAAEEEEREVNEAKRELAQRELARKYLLASVLRFNPEYMAGWVHKDICARLQKFIKDVEERRSPRLMLQMPPRHGKSTLASIEFPSYVLGLHPDWEIINCSYAESLALDFSRAVRERLRDKEYHVLWPKTRIDRENQNAQGWKTTKRGGFLPAGVGGPITGKGAHILTIDDPVKNSQEAESETTRESISRWYDSTAYTRLAPGGGVLIIQTRWHLDDLSGRLETKMEDGMGDVFDIIRYPAIATEDERFRKRGEPLHPERYGKEQLAMIEKAVGPQTWSALYQQNPVPEEGAAFDQGMIQYYQMDDLPEELTRVTAWDLAIGLKEANDKTVGLTWGKDITGDCWFLDCRHGHWDAKQIVDEICDSYARHKPYAVGLEKDKVGQAVGPYLDMEIENRELFGLYVEPLNPAREGNKLHRCRSLQGMMRSGRVWLPHPDQPGCSWVKEFVGQLMQFPYGRKDDFVDAAAWLALMAPTTPAPGLNYSKVPSRESWRDRLRVMSRPSKSAMSA